MWRVMAPIGVIPPLGVMAQGCGKNDNKMIEFDPRTTIGVVTPGAITPIGCDDPDTNSTSDIKYGCVLPRVAAGQVFRCNV